MFRFLSDMFIGWVIYTDSGKQVANTIINAAMNTIKKNVIKSEQLKELISLKEIFTNKGEKQNDDYKRNNEKYAGSN